MKLIKILSNTWERGKRGLKADIEGNKRLKKKYEHKWRNHSVYSDYEEQSFGIKLMTLVLYPPFLKNNWVYMIYAGFLFITCIGLISAILQYLF